MIRRIVFVAVGLPFAALLVTGPAGPGQAAWVQAAGAFAVPVFAAWALMEAFAPGRDSRGRHDA